MLRVRPAGTFVLSTVCFVATGTALALVACVDPKSDYDNYLARTEAGSSPTGDGGPISEGASPDAGFTQEYVMACTSQLANGSAARATYFMVTVAYTPGAPGEDGTLDFTDQALALGPPMPGYPSGSPPTRVSPGIGNVVTVNGSPVTPDGHCDVVFGPTSVPGAANPITGTDIQFTDSTLHFQVGPGSQLCAELSGDVTEPLILPLDPTQNICVFKETTGPVEPLTQSEVHCP
jgi:hypothetical protein